MARIEFIDQSLRDGQQSLWGMRMRAGHDAARGRRDRQRRLPRASTSPAARSSRCMVRFRQENPWEGLDRVRAALPNSVLRAGARTNGIVGMNITPDSIVELWIRTLAKHGIESFWIFDCLHNVDKMLDVAAKIARDAGMAPSPQVNFCLSPVHTDEYYAKSSAGYRRPATCPPRSSSATRPACSIRSGRAPGSG